MSEKSWSSVLLPLALSAGSVLACVLHQRKRRLQETNLKTYTGQCHCESVKFRCQAPEHLVVWDCNCSICNMRKNWHFIVPESSFELLEGEGEGCTTEYQFRTKTARHIFCSKCGVQSFYRPRSNPDGVGITFACITPDQIESYEIRKFDGQNWEEHHGKSGISQYSKVV